AHVLEDDAAERHPRHGHGVEADRERGHTEVAVIVAPGDALAREGRPRHQDVCLGDRVTPLVDDPAFDAAGRLLSQRGRWNETHHCEQRPKRTKEKPLHSHGGDSTRAREAVHSAFGSPVAETGLDSRWLRTASATSMPPRTRISEVSTWIRRSSPPRR